MARYRVAGRTIVVFDMDGVVVDTVPALYQAYVRFLAGFDVVGTRDEFAELNGPSLREIVDLLRDRHRLDPSPETLLERYLDEVALAYAATPLTPGLVDALAALRALGVGIALASSAPRRFIDRVLETGHLRGAFDMVVSGDEVARAKPDPEIYLRVLRRWPDARFFVVEDSAHGAAAAAAAGMEVILFGRDDDRRWGRATTDLADVVRFATEPDPLVDRVDARIVGEHRLAAEDEARVAGLWDAARLVDPRLFDGRVVCYRGHALDGTGLHLELDLCPYRHVFARLHSLALPGRLTPVGVSAIAIDSAGDVLIARRNRVTEYPGLLECVPSGGVAAPSGDRVDLAEQVATELAEEAPGLVWQRIEPLGVVTDELHGTFEVGFAIRCERLPRDLQDTDEYVDYQVVPLVQLPAYLADRPTVPTTRKLVRLALRHLGVHAAP